MIEMQAARAEAAEGRCLGYESEEEVILSGQGLLQEGPRSVSNHKRHKASAVFSIIQ
jgi:hypothetical protein